MLTRKNVSFLLCTVLLLTNLFLTGCASIPEIKDHNSKEADNGYSTISQSNLDSSNTINLNQNVVTSLYSVSIPNLWKVSHIGDSSGDVYFNKISDTNYGGGIYRQEYDVVEGESMPKMDALFQWMLPNHTVIKNTRPINGLSMESYLLHVEQSQPSASGSTITTNWTYIIFIDKKISTSTKFIAYELFLNNEIASEADTLKIAATFKLL